MTTNNSINSNIPIQASLGGTGNSSYTTGDMLFASSSSLLSKLAAVSVGNALISGGTGTAPSWGKIALSGGSAAVTGTLPIANGGTNNASQASNGINFFNGSSISSGSVLTFDGSSTLILSSSSATVSIQSKSTTSGDTAALYAVRQDNTGNAYVGYFNASNAEWFVGMLSGDNKISFHDVTNNLNRMVIDQSGNITIPSLTASLPVFTDSSSNLTSTGTVGVTHGGTGTSTAFTQGSLVFAGASGIYSQNNANLFWDDTNKRLGVGTSSPTLTFHVSNPSGLSSTAAIIQSTSTGASAELFIDRHDTSSLTSLIFSTAGSSDWSMGTSGSSPSLIMTSGSGNVLTLVGSGDVQASLGNMVVNTAGKTLKIKQGSNACSGTGATMSGGAVTVSTTAVATGDIVLVSRTTASGTLGSGMPTVSISNGVSFTLTSSNALETSTYSWVIIKAA